MKIMATWKTVSRLLAMMSIVLQDKETSEPFYKIYHEDLEDIPDHILVDAVMLCRKTCKFFPTIAEIRERAEPLLQQWSLENRKMLESNMLSKCHENVYKDEQNNPRCRIEDEDPTGCELAGTGTCGKWIDDMHDPMKAKG